MGGAAGWVRKRWSELQPFHCRHTRRSDDVRLTADWQMNDRLEDFEAGQLWVVVDVDRMNRRTHLERTDATLPGWHVMSQDRTFKFLRDEHVSQADEWTVTDRAGVVHMVLRRHEGVASAP